MYLFYEQIGTSHYIIILSYVIHKMYIRLSVVKVAFTHNTTHVYQYIIVLNFTCQNQI